MTKIIKKIPDLVWIIAILGFFLLLFLGSHGLVDPDEGRYCEVVREMCNFHSFVTPYINGGVFLDKPIIFYWLGILAIKVFGLSAFSMRFFPAMSAMLCAIFIYYAGKICFNRRVGLLGAFILGTMPFFWAMGHFANMDMEVASFISCSLLAFMIFLKNKKTSWILAAYGFAALAVLTKGLIGLAFPMMIVGLWILLLNRWAILKKMHIWSGLLLFLVIVLPWMIIIQVHHPIFFSYFIINQEITRYLSQSFNDKAPVWSYVAIVAGGSIPWVAFGCQSFWLVFKNIKARVDGFELDCFLLIWFFAILIFFSIPASKPAGYILPVFAPLALLIAKYLDSKWEKLRSVGISVGIWILVVLFVVAGDAALLLPHFNHSSHVLNIIPILHVLSAVLFVSALALIVLYFSAKKFLPIFVTLILSVMGICFCLLFAIPYLGTNTMESIAAHIKPFITKNTKIYSYNNYFYGLPFYLQRNIYVVNNWHINYDGDGWRGMINRGTKWNPSAKKWLISNNSFWQKWNASKTMIVVSSDNYLPDFYNQKIKPKIIARYEDKVAVVN